MLERSVFLNALLYRKGISWTRIFADLEKVVPHNVRIMSDPPHAELAEPGGAGYAGGRGKSRAGDRVAEDGSGSPLFGPASQPFQRAAHPERAVIASIA